MEHILSRSVFSARFLAIHLSQSPYSGLDNLAINYFTIITPFIFTSSRNPFFPLGI